MIQCEEIAWFIARAGLAVEIAHSGSSALRTVATARPRVVLLDYNLPDTTGVELAERVRTALPDAAIIIMSGRIDGLSEQTLERVGISTFVNKPIPLGPLRQTVQRLIRSGRANDDRPRPLEDSVLAGNAIGGVRC